MDSQIIVGDVEITCVTDAKGPFQHTLSILFPDVTPDQWLP
jgi:hypothetical protein